MVNTTICKVGCLMSSVSMALHGHHILIDQQHSNPGVLNHWLQKHGRKFSYFVHISKTTIFFQKNRMSFFFFSDFFFLFFPLSFFHFSILTLFTGGYDKDNDLEEAAVPKINPKVKWNGKAFDLTPKHIKQMLDGKKTVLIANVMHGMK